MSRNIFQAMAVIFLIAIIGGCANGNDDEKIIYKIKDHTVYVVETQTGKLTIQLDASSPEKKLLTGGSKNQTVANFKLSADNYEDLEINEFTVNDTGTAEAQTAENWYLYSSFRSDGGDILTPIATTVGKNANFILPAGTIIIPTGKNVVFKVTIDVGPVQPGTRVTLANYNGDTFQASVDATGLVVTGQTSGLVLDDAVITDTVKTTVHTVYQSRPYFALNASSPSGVLVPSVQAILAIYNIDADQGDDITFSATNNNYLSMEICTVCETHTVNEYFTLKDEVGNILSVVGPVDICTSPTIDFVFETNDLIIPHGTRKKIYVFTDTSEMINAGDAIQVWFSDEYPDNLDWSIDGSGNYNEGDVIFKGNLYANALIFL